MAVTAGAVQSVFLIGNYKNSSGYNDYSKE